jgi:RHS repeat-associated protein
MTDVNQAVVWRADYEPFGQAAVTVQTVVNNPLRLPGQYYDAETGLHYNYFRDYDPMTGRYLQSDPIGLAGGLNTYAYVGGNPVASVDPQGLEFIFFARPPIIPRYLIPRPKTAESEAQYLQRAQAGREAERMQWKPEVPVNPTRPDRLPYKGKEQTMKDIKDAGDFIRWWLELIHQIGGGGLGSAPPAGSRCPPEKANYNPAEHEWWEECFRTGRCIYTM